MCALDFIDIRHMQRLSNKCLHDSAPSQTKKAVNADRHEQYGMLSINMTHH